MQINWRWIHAARNSYAVLYAACERDGFLLRPVDSPADDVTCYSLNSINAPCTGTRLPLLTVSP